MPVPVMSFAARRATESSSKRSPCGTGEPFDRGILIGLSDAAVRLDGMAAIICSSAVSP